METVHMQKREETKLERRHREDLERLKRFRPMDDTFMRGLFKDDIPLYVIEHMNRTLSQPFEDGAHILYVNGEYRGDSALGKLMHDFNCTDAGEMNYELLAQKTRYLKENPKGVSEMCKVMEELRNESYAEGREEGRAEGTFATLAGLVRDGLLSIREASQRVNMTEQEFETALRKLK